MEQQQGGDPESISPLADDDAGEDQYCAKEKNVFRCECHSEWLKKFSVIFHNLALKKARLEERMIAQVGEA